MREWSDGGVVDRFVVVHLQVRVPLLETSERVWLGSDRIAGEDEVFEVAELVFPELQGAHVFEGIIGEVKIAEMWEDAGEGDDVLYGFDAVVA